MQVNAEFDRVRRVPESVATKKSRTMEQIFGAAFEILEDKRAEVMRNEQTRYFIQDWQELPGPQLVKLLEIPDTRFRP